MINKSPPTREIYLHLINIPSEAHTRITDLKGERLLSLYTAPGKRHDAPNKYPVRRYLLPCPITPMFPDLHVNQARYHITSILCWMTLNESGLYFIEWNRNGIIIL